MTVKTKIKHLLGIISQSFIKTFKLLKQHQLRMFLRLFGKEMHLFHIYFGKVFIKHCVYQRSLRIGS